MSPEQIAQLQRDRDRDVLLAALKLLSADECADTFVCPSLEPEDRCSSCISRSAIAQVWGDR